MSGLSPRTPPHSYTRPSEKHDPFIYFPYRKLTPFIYYFWKLTPFIYYFSNFTHSYTFRVKKIPHWYTFDVKMIPIHILGGLKSIPHSSRTSVYTFIMEVTPPCNLEAKKVDNLTFFSNIWQNRESTEGYVIYGNTNMCFCCIKRKGKRSDSVLWQKPLHRQKNSKSNVTTQKTPPPRFNLYKKRLLLRCIHHFYTDFINNMDHMRISGTEPSSVILSQKSNLKSGKVMLKNA